MQTLINEKAKIANNICTDIIFFSFIFDLLCHNRYLSIIILIFRNNWFINIYLNISVIFITLILLLCIIIISLIFFIYGIVFFSIIILIVIFLNIIFLNIIIIIYIVFRFILIVNLIQIFSNCCYNSFFFN